MSEISLTNQSGSGQVWLLSPAIVHTHSTVSSTKRKGSRKDQIPRAFRRRGDIGLGFWRRLQLGNGALRASPDTPRVPDGAGATCRTQGLTEEQKGQHF
ncbi:unnamed protein product [Boreogadus saida]